MCWAQSFGVDCLLLGRRPCIQQESVAAFVALAACAATAILQYENPVFENPLTFSFLHEHQMLRKMEAIYRKPLPRSKLVITQISLARLKGTEDFSRFL